MPNNKPHLSAFKEATVSKPYVFPCWVNAPQLSVTVRALHKEQGIGVYTGEGDVLFIMSGGLRHAWVGRNWLVEGVLAEQPPVLLHPKPALANQPEPVRAKTGKPLSKVLASALNRFDAACQEYAFRGSAHKDDAEERTLEYQMARKDLESAMDFYDDGAEVIKAFSDMIIETAANFNGLVRKVRDSRGA